MRGDGAAGAEVLAVDHPGSQIAPDCFQRLADGHFEDRRIGLGPEVDEEPADVERIGEAVGRHESLTARGLKARPS